MLFIVYKYHISITILLLRIMSSKRHNNEIDATSDPDIIAKTRLDVPTEGPYAKLLSDYIVEPYKYRNSPSTKPLVLVIMFIIIDEFPLETVWREWIGARKDIICIFHAKIPYKVSSEWVRSRLSNHPRASPSPPVWGSLELTQTMYYLLRYAIIDVNITHFAFASESCIPIVSSTKCMHELYLSNNMSWIYPVPKEGSNWQSIVRQFEPLEFEIPGHCVQKSSQWSLLSRKHVRQIVNFSQDTNMDIGSDFVANDRIWNLFRNVRPSDEVFIASILCMANGGVLQEPDICFRELTYTLWEPGSPHPRTFSHISENILRKAREKGCLFMRKIKLPNGIDTAKSCAIIIRDLRISRSASI